MDLPLPRLCTMLVTDKEVFPWSERGTKAYALLLWELCFFNHINSTVTHLTCSSKSVGWVRHFDSKNGNIFPAFDRHPCPTNANRKTNRKSTLETDDFTCIPIDVSRSHHPCCQMISDDAPGNYVIMWYIWLWLDAFVLRWNNICWWHNLFRVCHFQSSLGMNIFKVIVGTEFKCLYTLRLW